MLQPFRRHAKKCPHAKKGREWTKCKCPLHVDDVLENGQRYRASLKTRDWDRALRKLAELAKKIESAGTPAPPPKPPSKTLAEAVEKFLARYREGSDTRRKYKCVLTRLTEYCATKSISELMIEVNGQERDAITFDVMEGYEMWTTTKKDGWAWTKEIEILRAFFTFCVDRDWMRKNPAKILKRPKMEEANHIVPYTQEEVDRIVAACDQFGLGIYERLRARAYVLLMRYQGLRISDVVTLSREHIHGNRLVKRAVKNRKWINMELHPEVLKALEALPRPKAASADCPLYFTSENSSQRSSVKGAQRTMWAVFEIAKVPGAHPHRFRHTFASEAVAKGVPIPEVAGFLADTEAVVRKHYFKWTPEYQARQDAALRLVHGTKSTPVAA